ncbi:MAG: hypothetical protein Tsb0016_10660 [Sphingomonadales bacterium]
MLAAMPARAEGFGLSVEGGFGLSFLRGSGSADFDFLGQPFAVADSNLLGAGGRGYSLGGWAHVASRPNWALGLEYLALNGDGALLGTAPAGIDILADPTTGDTRLTARRRQVFLSLGWRPYVGTQGRALVALGAGYGDGQLNAENRVSSDFLGVLQDQVRRDFDLLSLKLALGYDQQLTDRFSLGLRGHYIRDLANDWPRGRTGAMAFQLVGAMRFGDRQGNEVAASGLAVAGGRLALSVERVQGAYNVKIKAMTRSPLGLEQPLEFRTRDLFNGQSTLLTMAWSRRAPWLCRSDDCPWRLAVEPFYQRGRARLDAVIAAEGPLVGRDNVLAARARVDALGGFVNLAYAPRPLGRWQPSVAAGLGAAYIDADLINDDLAGDIFTRTGGTDFAIVPQLLVAIDYVNAGPWRLGGRTRLMARQMSFGLALARRF